MANPLLTKTYTADGEVPQHRIVKATATGKVAVASAPTNALYGVSDELGADAGERVDVVVIGMADVEYGGPIAAGDQLTSDATGRAVKAGAAGQTHRVIGTACVAGVTGDIGCAILDRSSLTTPA